MNESDRTYRVFISSTYRDNKKRREVLIKAIMGLEMQPVCMEAFTASSSPTVEECLKHARECDVYIGVLAWRHGWILEGHEKSITELEYEAAGLADKPRFMFIIEGGRFPPNDEGQVDEGDDDTVFEQLRRLQEFKKRVRACPSEMATPFDDHSLSGKVVTALEEWRREQHPPKSIDEPDGAATVRNGGQGQVHRQLQPQVLIDYFADIEEHHSYVDFVGFEKQLRVPFEIEELHVELSAAYNFHDCGAVFPDSEEAKRKMDARGRKENFPLSELFRCAMPGRNQESSKAYRAFVLLGDPGSGKTTHLRHLAVLMARGQAAHIGLPADTVPLFLPLRELEPGDSDFETFVRARLKARHRQVRDVETLLKHRNLLFLIDGLDEIPDLGRRKKISGWIEQHSQAYSQSRFVVTCRYAGYNEKVRLPAKFLELHLRPLSRDRVETFVDRWYHAVETRAAKGEQNSEATAKFQAQALCQRLFQGDFRTARVAKMTGNPLLLTTICLVHRDRGGLPQERHKLFEACVVLLLELWSEKARKQKVTFSADKARAALQPMAYWLHGKQERTRASASELKPILDPHLPSLSHSKDSNLSAAEFLETIKNESGLLTGWSAEHFGFLHLGFQEYLAAQEIRNRFINEASVLDELLGHFGESWWREVISLLVALTNPSLAKPFFERLVELPQFAEHPDLVNACLEDAAEVVSEPFERVLAGGAWGGRRFMVAATSGLASDARGGTGAGGEAVGTTV